LFIELISENLEEIEELINEDAFYELITESWKLEIKY
jgi:hypothetical protein